jgi:phosphatidylglycerol:prolipoprotein diacylglycerol transferase
MGPYVHDIDPVIRQVSGVYLWWYGLGYTLAFIQLLSFLLGHRASLRLTRADAWRLALTFATGVLLGGRTHPVVLYDGLKNLTIPSNWTQDVPARYGTRHPGMRHSAIYPPIETARYR